MPGEPMLRTVHGTVRFLPDPPSCCPTCNRAHTPAGTLLFEHDDQSIPAQTIVGPLAVDLNDALLHIAGSSSMRTR